MHEVDLSYHMPGLGHTLILKSSQRREVGNCEDGSSPPKAKLQCVTRKVLGRVKSSHDSQVNMPRAKRMCRPTQGRGHEKLHCRYAQGRNVSGSFYTDYGPYL